jgi:hypothetical protein
MWTQFQCGVGPGWAGQTASDRCSGSTFPMGVESDMSPWTAFALLVGIIVGLFGLILWLTDQCPPHPPGDDGRSFSTMT